MLFVAEHFVHFRKGQEWGTQQVAGCLGFPGAILSFCIVDAIGSFHRGDKSLAILIDGKARVIRNDASDHFFILNSAYYSLALNGDILRKIHLNFRNILVHNLALPPEHLLQIGRDAQKPIEILRDTAGKKYPVVRLKPFLSATQKAVEEFVKRFDSIVQTSRQNGVIHSKPF
jgi:hypothetical protein